MAQARKKSDTALRFNLGRHARILVREAGFLTVLALAVFLVLALMTYHPLDPAWTHTGADGGVRNLTGVSGALFADVTLYFLGRSAYLIPLLIAFAGWRLFRREAITALDPEVVLLRTLGVVAMLGTAAALLSRYYPLSHPMNTSLGGDLLGAGGVLGDGVGGAITTAFGYIPGMLFLFGLLGAGTTLATGLGWSQVLEGLGRSLLWAFGQVTALFAGLGSLAARAPQRVARAMKPVAAGPELDDDTDADTQEPKRSGRSPAKRKLRIGPVVDENSVEAPWPEPAAPRGSRQEPSVAEAFTETPPIEPTLWADDEPGAGTDLTADLPDDDEPLPDNDWQPSPVALRETLVPPPRAPIAPAPADERSPWDDVLDSRPAAPVVRPASPPAPKPPLVAAAQRLPLGAIPGLELLDRAPEGHMAYAPEVLEEMSRHVEVLLKHFGVDVTVVAVEPGPVITRFELDPAPGVKVSQISNLAKDLARGLSVISVRVVEVIPGKSVVGLEIPNQRREIVYLADVISSEAYRSAASPTTLALGKDIGGRPVVANLSKMPHLLVAGTTGSGKSVAINAMLLSLLYKATPDQVRLILVDPKMLELSVYEDIPHLLAPVVTDMKEAANALRWCVGEMERRYRLMAALKVRNIAGFNRMVTDAIEAGAPMPDPLYRPEDAFDPEAPVPGLEPLPFIVVVIDELADMMMIVGKKVEELIARLAQKARASGIHLILATQRPSVDVITGLIKANIPTRIAFQVSSKVDSRTILDQMGAEQLLGHGDMLYLPPGTGFPHRVHGAFVDDHEVNQVVAFLKQTGRPQYLDDILEEPTEGIPGLSAEASGVVDVDSEADPLYDQAVRIVTESRRASISGVQRRLKIGYNRAARMIEDMERAGIVGTLQSNGNREVLAPPPPGD